jgi:hypothetical protein
MISEIITLPDPEFCGISQDPVQGIPPEGLAAKCHQRSPRIDRLIEGARKGCMKGWLRLVLNTVGYVLED